MVRHGAQKVRIRGHAHANLFAGGAAPQVSLRLNGAPLQTFPLERTGLFILEADVPEAAMYELEINASPTWQAPPDDRTFTVNLSMIRLDPRD